MRRVPLTRRNPFADPRRLVISALGVGVALMLILLLGGLWTGTKPQVTMSEDHTGAQLYVVTPGTLNLFADSSTLPRAAVDQVRLPTPRSRSGAVTTASSRPSVPPPARLAALAFGPTLSLSLLGAVAAAVLFIGGRAAIVPARRVARLDPAAAFRSSS